MKEAVKGRALLLLKKIMTTVLPAFLGLFAVVALVGTIVVAVLAVIYNSPLSVFFPLPDTGYDDPRTVLSSYYMEFNQKIMEMEDKGDDITYQNTENGAPISNFNDTLMVYMILYSDGKAGYVMDEEGKKNLKKVFDEMNYIDKESSAAGQAVAELAMTKIGCRYDQDRRYEEGYYDCSSLVQRLYKEAGIELPATASEQGRYCYQNAMLINKKDLKPGDLIFYSYEDNGQFRDISHVAIYVGNGMMVHAANPERGVVLDPLRDGRVVFYARPYK